MSEVALHAPFAGWLAPLDEVPDPVFAERMMGDGVAIDPVEDTLRAPADAEVIAVPETGHAVTLRLANGAELLIHIGLETVALGGAGFRPLVTAGARVKRGDPLIGFDMDAVARGARSLVTPIVVASEGGVLALEVTGRAVQAGERIGSVSTAASAQVQAGSGTAERVVRITAPHGIHARPAARIAARLKPFAAEVSLRQGERQANALSTVALLGLGVRHNDDVRIVASGADADAAVEALAALIESGLGEEQESSAPTPPPREGGICAAPGLAIGRIVQFRAADLPVPADGTGIAEERKRLESALAEAAGTLGGGPRTVADIAAAHRALLEDPELLARASAEIAEGRSAAFGWRSACTAAREAIRATGDALLMERVADLLDIERRVIALLVEDGPAAVPTLPPDAILIAPDLLPSQFLALDKERLAGICTAEGGPTSHVAILAAAANVPMLVAAGAAVLDAPDGTPAILDAGAGRLEIDPSVERLSEASAHISERRARRAAEARAAHALCTTADGTRIEVFANLGSVEDAGRAVAAGAEGCGLLRTEFLFLDREFAPDEGEQSRVYSEIAAVLGERPLIVRTLDIGGDKPVPYLPMPREENPALGCRGIRLGLARPDMLETQFRAILRAVPGAQCKIMLPMIVDLGEFREARRLLDRAATAVGRSEPVSLGVMIETPAAAMLAGMIAEEADFLSVGTNDLTQYALACDRGNAAVSAKVDAFHPAVLRLIREAAAGAAKHGRWLGVCGGLASDPLAASLLIGLGVTELSAAPAAVPAVKAAVRRLDSIECRALAERACAAASAEEARAIAAEGSA